MSTGDASDALKRIQRQATVRLWTAAVAVVLVWFVGAVGFLRVRAQRVRVERAVMESKRDAILLKREYDDKRKALDAERNRWLDGSLWQAYRRFSACNSPIGQVLTAFEALEHMRQGRLTSDRPWTAAMSDGLARCPRLIYSTPIAPKWSVVRHR